MKEANNDEDLPPPFCINVDGTAGSGKYFLIWTITSALKLMWQNELQGQDPVVRLAPTGVAAFGIRGWAINFGLLIPVREGREFSQLGETVLARLQARWKNKKILILDEKSMVGRAQFGRMDRRMCQANPHTADEVLGGLPAIIFGDFSQLPPIGDTPLYSTCEPKFKKALHEEGRRAFESFTQTVTLGQVFRQQGNDPQQVKFRDALMQLRNYATTDEDFDLFASRMWDNLTPAQHSEFDDVLYLLPTKAAVHELNK